MLACRRRCVRAGVCVAHFVSCYAQDTHAHLGCVALLHSIACAQILKPLVRQQRREGGAGQGTLPPLFHSGPPFSASAEPAFFARSARGPEDRGEFFFARPLYTTSIAVSTHPAAIHAVVTCACCCFTQRNLPASRAAGLDVVERQRVCITPRARVLSRTPRCVYHQPTHKRCERARCK